MIIDFEKELTFLEGDVDVSSATRDEYSHDASVFEIRPQVVVYPKHSLDIQKLVMWVKENKHRDPELSITARAAGTCMSGGSINDSIILDTTRYMNQIFSVGKTYPENIMPHFEGSKEVVTLGEARVQPGVFYRDLEKQTLEQGFILPCYTASKSINAMGGMIGNNSGGELTLRYGKMEDYVKELKVIFQDGHEYTIKPVNRREMYSKIAQVDFEGQMYKKMFDLITGHETMIKAGQPRVSKNSAGYNLWNVISKVGDNEPMFDLCQIVIGSQGTLGIVTEMTLRLVPVQKATKLVTIMMQDLTNLGDLVAEIDKTIPESVESYDDKTFGLAMRFFKDFVKSKGFFNTIGFGLKFLPEFGMMMTGGIPKLIVLVEYAGESDEAVTKKAEELLVSIQKFGHKARVIHKKSEAKKYWDMRRDSFALLRKHTEGRRTAPFIDDIIVKPEYLPEFLPKLNELFKEYPELIYTIAGHAGNGNFHIIPLMDFNNPRTAEIITELSDRVYDLVLSYHGSITAEHNDGLIRTPFLEKMFGPEMCALFGEVKHSFDPENIFNPKKKVGATKEDIAKYLIRPEVPGQVHSS